jgi:hypothetical protein
MMELRIYHDTVSLKFDEPGDATVRVVGMRRPGDTPYVIERSTLRRCLTRA